MAGIPMNATPAKEAAKRKENIGNKKTFTATISKQSKQTIMNTERELAMKWWRKLIPIEQWYLTTKYYQVRKWHTLTGREIQHIYSSENKQS